MKYIKDNIIPKDTDKQPNNGYCDIGIGLEYGTYFILNYLNYIRIYKI